MKIAFLSRYQNSIERGGETFVKELANALAKNNQVDVLSGKDADNIQKIIEGKYDIVVPLNGRLQAFKVCFGRLFGKYKVVIAGESGIGRDDIWNIVMCRPDAFVALTEKAFKWGKGLPSSSGVKIVKIPNGVDLDKFNPKGEKYNVGLKSPVILSVGALVWYKHHEKTIEAVSLLENVSLLIVGKGDQKDYLEKIGKEKLGDRFKIIEVDYKKMPEVYLSADLFTLPSWDREAFGIVYLEAMATNLPVVAPNDSNRKEIVGDAGILVDVNDPQKYSEAIQKSLEIKWGDKPRKQAEKFSWDLVAQKYEKLFEEVLNG